MELEMTANVGTPVFSAPEIQSDDHSATYSTKVDVFSFGIIIWTLMTRRRPYSDGPVGRYNTFKLMTCIIEGLRPPVDSATFPPKLCTLMERCWAGKS